LMLEAPFRNLHLEKRNPQPTTLTPDTRNLKP
jgi:hypothetical protein